MARRRYRGQFHLWPTEKVHAVAFKLNQAFLDDIQTEKQAWLWTVLVNELEWRWHHPSRHPFTRCHCDLCRPPFPRNDLERPDPSPATEDAFQSLLPWKTLEALDNETPLIPSAPPR